MANPTHPNLRLLRIRCIGLPAPATFVVVFQGLEVGRRRLNNPRWRQFANPKPTQPVPEPVVSPMYLYREPFNPGDTPLFSSVPISIGYNQIIINPTVVEFMPVPGAPGTAGLTPRLEYTVNYAAIAPEPLMYFIRPVLLLVSTVVGIVITLATSVRSLLALLIVPLLNLIGGRPNRGDEDDEEDNSPDEDDENGNPKEPNFPPPQ